MRSRSTRHRSAWVLIGAAAVAGAGLAPGDVAVQAAPDDTAAVPHADMRILRTPPDVHFRVQLDRNRGVHRPERLTGARGWSVRLRKGAQDRVWPTPATDGERVFLGGPLESSTFYAVHAATGRLAWKAQLTDNGPTPAVVRDRRVYFNTQSCTLYAYDSRSGRRVWSRYLAGSLVAVPTLAGDHVLSPRPHRSEVKRKAEREQAALTALHAANGKIVADVTIDGDGIGAPVVRDDKAYLTTRSGAVYCIDLETAQAVWRQPVGASSAPWVDETGVYLRCGTRLDRLNARTGASHYDGVAITPSSRNPYAPATLARPEVPAADLRGASEAGFWGDTTGPVIAAGRLCLAAGRTLRLYAPRTGVQTALWELDVKGAFVGSPCVAGNTVVVATDAGEVRAVDVRDGEIVWAADISATLGSGVIVDSGRLFATTRDGRLVCVEVGDLRADGWPMWGGTPSRTAD